MHKEQEVNIALALNNSGIISLAKTTTDITSIARKWRSVLIKLGFLWPDTEMRPKIKGVSQSEIGSPFTLTPNGSRLLAAKSLRGEQEVILRSLAALQLPSPLEPHYHFTSFSPLKHVIRILNKLESLGEEPYISRLEMASIVILSNGEDSIEHIAEELSKQRHLRNDSASKRRFAAQTIRTAAATKGQRPGTLYDYQDVSFRYLKATGLFQSRGRGISFVPEKRKTADLIAAADDPQLTPAEYLNLLASGSALPTDTHDGASEVLSDLLSISSDWDIQFDTSAYDLSSPSSISLARHDLEQEIFEAKEVQFARNQRRQIDEILTYLEMLDENRSTQQFGEEELVIPREERPAYFEWILWRVLLALDHLVVPPSKVRRFNVDQDFLPVGTASGGGADVIAEYADSVLVVEVTLTENSRQEAAEGEPVRRHVADVLEAFEPLGKAVYGLFIARRIDTNTAETFRIGVWYRKNDERITLDVVPITLKQLRAILNVGVQEETLEPKLLIDFIQKASLVRPETKGAPEWKGRIAEIVGS